MCPEIPKPKLSSASANIEVVIDSDGNAHVKRIEQSYAFAYELRNAARVMAHRARDTPDEPETHLEMRAFVHGAVVLAYAALEAALNETIHIHAVDPASPIGKEERKVFEVIGEEELKPRSGANTLEMFNTLLRIIGKPPLPTDKQPYQGANLLRMLRNMLAHPVPGRVVTYADDETFDYSSQQDIVKRLRSHLRLDRNTTFPDGVLTARCAAWAVKSSESFLREFVVRSGIEPGFKTD